MSQGIDCDSLCEDTKYLIDIKEEPFDAPSVTDIAIKHDSPCATVTAEIDIKEEPWEIIDVYDLNLEMRSYDSRNVKSNSSHSNSMVCIIKYSF